MNEFPSLPCHFHTDDRELLSYIKKHGTWGFLSHESIEKISGLASDKSLAEQLQELVNLWPLVLTDALKHLKLEDTRECDPKFKGKVSYESFFNREALGVKTLQEIMAAFSAFEGLMYGAQPQRYRDHMAHAFRVWIMGHGFLKTAFGGKLSTPGNTFIISPKEWECIWALTALCHDIGYPLSALRHVNDRAKGALHALGVELAGNLSHNLGNYSQPLHDCFLRLMSSKPVLRDDGKDDEKRWFTHLQNKYYMKFLNSLDSLKHGVLSSLVLGRSLVYFLEADYTHDHSAPLKTEDARQFLIRREILRAIAAHTCPEIYHLTFDSLAFLLYVTDELQCWGRPTFESTLVGWQDGLDKPVIVEQLEAKKLRARIKVPKPWADREKGAAHQIGDFSRRIRLAVGSSAFEGIELRFGVATGDGKRGHMLIVKNGRLREKKS